ncbi:MAG: RNA polymerase sigma factor, partial [uncultured Acidimicrobiales bacterium]
DHRNRCPPPRAFPSMRHHDHLSCDGAGCSGRRGPRRARRHRGAPGGAHGPLLPDARLRLRGRGRRAGDDGAGLAVGRPLRGALRPALVALPHRHERLPRHAPGAPAPGTPHGPRPGRDVGDPHRGGRPRARLGPAGGRRPCRARRRGPGRAGGGARLGPPRLRGRPPAPAATPAGRAAPQGGPAVAGVRGGRAPRHHRRLRQQRPPAGSGHHGGHRRRCHPLGPGGRRAAGAAGPLRRGVRALRRRLPGLAAPGGRRAVDAAVRALAAGGGRHRPLVHGTGRRLPRRPHGAHRRQRPPRLRRLPGQRTRHLGPLLHPDRRRLRRVDRRAPQLLVPRAVPRLRPPRPLGAL